MGEKEDSTKDELENKIGELVSPLILDYRNIVGKINVSNKYLVGIIEEIENKSRELSIIDSSIVKNKPILSSLDFLIKNKTDELEMVSRRLESERSLLSSEVEKIKKDKRELEQERLKFTELLRDNERTKLIQENLIKENSLKLEGLRFDAGRLENEIKLLNFNLSESKKDFRKLKEIAETHEKEFLKKKLENELQIKILEKRMVEEQNFLSKLSSEIELNKDVSEKIKEQINQKNKFDLQLTALQVKIFQESKQLQELYTFREQLNKKEKELDDRENDIYVMEKRIKPKYQKIFNQTKDGI